MNFRKWTLLIMTIAFYGLIVWDYIAFRMGNNSTISVIMTDWYYTHPLYSIMIINLMGMLQGHWFAPAKGSKD